MKTPIHNIHDKIIKETFSNINTAKAYFLEFLPENLKAVLDFNSVVLINGSYVSPDLQEYFSDLLFQFILKETDEHLIISLLFEHKYKRDKHTLIQVGNYIFNQWSKEIKSKIKLKPIIPLIYYQGKEEWKIPSIEDLFALYPDSIKCFLPSLDFIFFALNKLSIDQFDKITDTMLLIALAGHDPKIDVLEFFNRVKNILSLKQLNLEQRNFLSLVFVYKISNNDSKITKIVDLIKDLPNPINNELMSTYEMIKAEGKVEAKVEMILAMSKDGFDIATIAKIAKMSHDQIKNIVDTKSTTQ